MTAEERQPMLFADLPIPSAPPEARRSCPRRRNSSATRRRRAVQLVLDFDFREFGPGPGARPHDEGDDEFDWPKHGRSVHGRDPAPITRAASSVWDLAAAARPLPRWRSPGAAGDAAQPPILRVERDVDGVRVVRLRPEETEEWAERERARRAKQRPPKPTKQAKTRGKKVRGWDGEVVED